MNTSIRSFDTFSIFCPSDIFGGIADIAAIMHDYGQSCISGRARYPEGIQLVISIFLFLKKKGSQLTDL